MQSKVMHIKDSLCYYLFINKLHYPSTTSTIAISIIPSIPQPPQPVMLTYYLFKFYSFCLIQWDNFIVSYYCSTFISCVRMCV